MSFESLEFELEQHQKHILLANGLFEWEDVRDTICCCLHPQNSHLDATDLCLDSECICEKFVSHDIHLSTVIEKKTKQEKGKDTHYRYRKWLTKKENEQTDVVVVNDGQVIQSDNTQNQLFLREYDIGPYG